MKKSPTLILLMLLSHSFAIQSMDNQFDKMQKIKVQLGISLDFKQTEKANTQDYESDSDDDMTGIDSKIYSADLILHCLQEIESNLNNNHHVDSYQLYKSENFLTTFTTIFPQVADDPQFKSEYKATLTELRKLQGDNDLKDYEYVSLKDYEDASNNK